MASANIFGGLADGALIGLAAVLLLLLNGDRPGISCSRRPTRLSMIAISLFRESSVRYEPNNVDSLDPVG